MKTTTQKPLKEDQSRSPILPPFPSVHIIDSFSGGKGKSTFSRFLAHHIEYNEFNGVLFDADLKTTDGSVKGNISPIYPETVDLDIRTDLSYGSSKVNQKILDCLRSGLNVLINLPGSSFEFSSAWLRDSNLLDVRLKLAGTHYIYDAVEPEQFQDLAVGALVEGLNNDQGGRWEASWLNLASETLSLDALIQGKQPIINRWHLSGCTEIDGQEFMAAVRYYDQLCPGRIRHILVRNEALLPSSLRIDWDPLYAVEGLSDLVCRNDIYTVDFPRLAQPEVDILNREKLSYAAAMTCSDLTTTSRGRIYRFLRDTTVQVVGSGLMNNFVKLTTIEPTEAYHPSKLRIDTRQSKPESNTESKSRPKAESKAKSRAKPKPESKAKSRVKSKAKSKPAPEVTVDADRSDAALSLSALGPEDRNVDDPMVTGLYQSENGDLMDDLSAPSEDVPLNPSLGLAQADSACPADYDELGLGDEGDDERVDADDPEAFVSWGLSEGLSQASSANGHKG